MSCSFVHRIRALAASALVLASFATASGQGTITGIVSDSTGRAPLAFVNMVATRTDDSTRWAGGTTNAEGRFNIGPLTPGTYLLKATFIGYIPMDRAVTVGNTITDLGAITMARAATELPEAEVEAIQTRAEQIGDTTQFNAGAYQTAPDASAEDLLKKLPGVTQEGGTLKVQGEEVRRVLVDGKELFGEDPGLALKSLPAEIVAKIQVFEQQSDQARFTGFDDGTGGKAINIITRPGMAHGIFGRLYAGHNATDLYSTGGNVNLMQGARRITLVAMSNNINQQNFSDQDLLGVTGEGETRGGRGGGGRGGGGTRGGRGGGGGSGNFLVGPLGGVATTHAIGLNYGDNWGQRTEVSGSYFLNISERDLRTTLIREQILPGDSGLFYSEQQQADSRNANHRVNLRLTHNADSSNTFILTPRLNVQGNRSDDRTAGVNAFPSGTLDSRTDNINTSVRSGWTFNTGLLWQHRFAKKGRTFSAQADVEMSEREADRLLYSLNLFDLLTDTNLLDRQTDELTSGHRFGGRFTYTEPLEGGLILQLNYAPSYTSGHTDRVASAFDPDQGTYSVLDSSLSNRFESTFERNRGGVSLRHNGDQWSWNLGLDAQYAILTGDREFPTPFFLGRSFYNALPNAMLSYAPQKGTSLRIFYRTSTREPSIDQLQDVVDISNPLFLRTGNVLLSQSYAHNLFARYGRTVAEKGTSFFALVGGGLTDAYIGTSSTVATNAPVEVDGILIPAGGQLSRPVNLDGAWNARAFVTYGMPINKIKSNININGAYNFNQLPALINDQTNLASNHALSHGVMLSSNISERIDFALGYTANWNLVRNSLQQNADNDFLSTTGTLRLQWTTLGHVVLRSNMAYTRFDGLAEEIDADYLLWNGSVGYKLLKDRSLEVALNCFDILGQNNSIARNITETWIEDSRTNVLGQYVMLVVTWNLRYFKKAPSGQGNTPMGGSQ